MAFDLAAVLKDATRDMNVPPAESIRRIDIDLIDGDDRNFYSLSGIEGLAANIEFNGLLDPLRVRPADGGRYTVVSGHRRLAALDLLVSDGRREFASVPCIIDDRAAGMNDALQELRLIYANSDTRKMTPTDLQRQAERVAAILTDLKAQGFEFSGRMRDQVAAICSVSSAKLAKLNAIKSNLMVEIYVDYFETGKIGETVAYEISQLPTFKQGICLRRLGDGEELTVETVREMNGKKNVFIMNTQDEKENVFKTNTQGEKENVFKTNTQDGEKDVFNSNTQNGEKDVFNLNTVPVWLDGSPDADGEYLALLDCNGSKLRRLLQYHEGSGKWTFGTGANVEAGILGWYPIPDIPEEE